jgi:hypothetical protein
MPPQSIPTEPPVTLQLGFPVIQVPGCVESRNTQPGNSKAYDNDPKGNFVVCDGTMPSFRPLDFSPALQPPEGVKPPKLNTGEDEPKETAKTQSAVNPLPVDESGIPILPKELPCPPPDAIPIGAKNKLQTAVIIGYEVVDGKCEPQLELLPVAKIVGNYLPGAPVVMTTAAIAAVATTSAIVAKPLGDILLKAVKPIVKKTIKKIKEKLGKKVVIDSAFQRRKNQRALRK